MSWAPGEPLMPDNGCGPMTTVTMTADERANVIAEGGTPPPWWRPDPTTTTPGHMRRCVPCGVTWQGQETCWNCGVEKSA